MAMGKTRKSYVISAAAHPLFVTYIYTHRPFACLVPSSSQTRLLPLESLPMSSKIVTLEELKTHTTKDSLYLLISGKGKAEHR